MKPPRRVPRWLKWVGLSACGLVLVCWGLNAFWVACWNGPGFSVWLLGGYVGLSRDGWSRDLSESYLSLSYHPDGLGGFHWPKVFGTMILDNGKKLWEWAVVIPLWVPLLLAGVPTAYLFWRDSHRVLPGRCRQCEYDLTGNASGICPECGMPVKCLDSEKPESPSPRSRFVWYLLAESLFAAGAALSCVAAGGFLIEVMTRPASPASMMPLFAPAVGCAAFLWGLTNLLRQDRQKPPLTRNVAWCLLIGLAATGLPPRLREEMMGLRTEITELRSLLQTAGIGPAKTDEKSLLTAQEFADLTGFSVHSIRDWCERGQLPGMKIGNRWRLDRQKAMMALETMDRKKRRKRRAQDAA